VPNIEDHEGDKEMHKAFCDTEAAAEFVATADSRQTSPKIMEAIVFFARNVADAEALWSWDGFGRICSHRHLGACHQ
jgi:hypothetical protein